MTGIVATAETDINATPAQVWNALVDPKMIKKYMFGTQVETDWQPGSAIVWKGEYEGKSYQDKGKILLVRPGQRLQVTHFSPLSGQKDEPANYHTLTYDLSDRDGTTHLSLSQDNNADQDEAEHSKANWAAMLKGLKETVEAA